MSSTCTPARRYSPLTATTSTTRGGRCSRPGSRATTPYRAIYTAPTGYTVTVYLVGQPTAVATLNAAAGTTSITATGLVNASAYYATVVAQYSGGPGVSATTNTATAGAPGADALAGAGDRPSFSFNSYPISDQVNAKVNVGSGNLEVTQGDFSLPGVSGRYPFSQVFNSLALSATSSSAGSALLSPGWRTDSSPDVRLVVGSGRVVYYDPTGAAWAIAGSGNGPFTVPAGMDATLVHNADTTWTLTDHAANQATVFDGAGVAIKFSDRNANPVTFSYDSQAANTYRLTSPAVYNPANSTMVTAGGDGRLHQIDLAAGDGQAARSTKFVYDTNSNLQTVTDMANEVTTYGYDTGHNLTSITTAGGRQTNFGYDNAHRVITVTRLNPGHPASVTGYDLHHPRPDQRHRSRRPSRYVDLDEDRSLFDLGGLAFDLEELLGCAIDVGLDDSFGEPTRDQVLAEAVAL